VASLELGLAQIDAKSMIYVVYKAHWSRPSFTAIVYRIAWPVLMLISSLGHPVALHQILHAFACHIVHTSGDLIVSRSSRQYSDECHVSGRKLDVRDLPPYIILLRHGEVGAGLIIIKLPVCTPCLGSA
jgi:hypothetical protein